jgi:hypothetical protein
LELSDGNNRRMDKLHTEELREISEFHHLEAEIFDLLRCCATYVGL